MKKRVEPPGGQAPPAYASDGTALEQLASEVANRYFAEFPDDLDRYGPVARDWAIHDTKYQLAWAANPYVDLDAQVTWLANILAARDFPVDRLARNLVLAADVAETALPDAAPRLLAAATRLRERL